MALTHLSSHTLPDGRVVHVHMVSQLPAAHLEHTFWSLGYFQPRDLSQSEFKWLIEFHSEQIKQLIQADIRYFLQIDVTYFPQVTSFVSCNGPPESLALPLRQKWDSWTSNVIVFYVCNIATGAVTAYSAQILTAGEQSGIAHNDSGSIL